MKKYYLSILVIALLQLVSCNNTPSLDELAKFAPTESFPEDAFLSSVQNKRALVIVAHDDDDCAMSGTIAKLTAEGWTIKQLSLVSHPDPKTGKNSADIICQGNRRILDDGIYRIGLDTMKTPYHPIPYEKIKAQFLTDKVSQRLVQLISEFKPSVIFTLDNIKGGYGHPEHIFISQLVLELFQEDKIAVQRIYQSVFTDHMEKEIVDTWLKAKMDKWELPHPSTIANKMYGIDGMPDPTVQVNIKTSAQQKWDYLMAYPEDVQKNLRKFIPFYDKYGAEEYFSLFDREFFRVIEKESANS